jgi:hypothetical protein
MVWRDMRWRTMAHEVQVVRIVTQREPILL